MADPLKNTRGRGPDGLPDEFYRGGTEREFGNELLTPGMPKNVCPYYLTL